MLLFCMQDDNFQGLHFEMEKITRAICKVARLAHCLLVFWEIITSFNSLVESNSEILSAALCKIFEKI